MLYEVITDGRDFVAHTGLLGQLVDDLGPDEGGVHVEGHEAAVAPKDVVFLQGDVHAHLLGDAQEP